MGIHRKLNRSLYIHIQAVLVKRYRLFNWIFFNSKWRNREWKGWFWIMENKILLEKFTEIANSRKAVIVELQHLYLLKQIENEIVQERFKEIYNKVLAENPFYSERDCERSRSGNKIFKGDRIFSSDDQWCRSTEDYNRFLEICREEDYAADLTDEEGRYTEEANTENQLREIKEKLIRLSVEILPDDFPNKKLLEDAIEYKGHNSYKIRETLFELVMKLKLK